jgi:hypothetical protein
MDDTAQPRPQHMRRRPLHRAAATERRRNRAEAAHPSVSKRLHPTPGVPKTRVFSMWIPFAIFPLKTAEPTGFLGIRWVLRERKGIAATVRRRTGPNRLPRNAPKRPEKAAARTPHHGAAGPSDGCGKGAGRRGTECRRLNRLRAHRAGRRAGRREPGRRLRPRAQRRS